MTCNTSKCFIWTWLASGAHHEEVSYCGLLEVWPETAQTSQPGRELVRSSPGYSLCVVPRKCVDLPWIREWNQNKPPEISKNTTILCRMATQPATGILFIFSKKKYLEKRMRSQRWALSLRYIFSSKKQKTITISFLLWDEQCETDAFRYLLYNSFTSLMNSWKAIPK